MELAMSKNVNTSVDVKQVARDAHWGWMARGWEAFKLTRAPSLKIGASVVIFSGLLVFALYKLELGVFIPAAYGAFALVGPVIASLIYAISRKLEDDGKVRKLRTVNLSPSSPSQVGFIGFTLLVIVMIWVLLALLIYALSVGIGAPMNEADFIKYVLTTPRGLMMAVLGTAVGGTLALIGYAISAISIPLAFERDIDALSAMAASAQAVIKNPTTMLSWAFVISVMVALSAPFAFLPMIIAFPWLGHTTWQAYRDLIE